MRRVAPAAERNKAPILEVLRRVLPSRGTLLEIASGTGQHAAYFAEHLPSLEIQPSDPDAENLESIRAWRAEAARPNLRAPVAIDARASDWGMSEVEAVFCANMVHIAPWEAAVGLFEGAARHLAPDGVLVIYGPFSIGGAHTAPSNAAFDAQLRARDAAWGVRDLDELDALAARVGLRRVERVEMPANNQMLVFRRMRS